VGIPYESNLLSYREESLEGTPQWLNLVSGGQYVGVWDAYGSYLETGDTGFSFRWKFWARGTGTIALTQDTDPTWSTTTLPSTSIGNLVVSASDWTVYHVAAGTIVLADFLDFDGIRLGFNCTSGDVDITTCQLECVPTSGTTGWWVNQPSYDDSFTDNAHSIVARVLENTDTTGGASIVTALETSYAAQEAKDILNFPPSTSFNPYGPTIGGFMQDWVRGGFTPVPFIPEDQAFGNLFVGGGVMTVNGSPNETYPQTGDDGVDYIRIPGYTLYDGDSYVRSAANRNNLPEVHTTWVTPHIWYRNDLGTYASGPYDGLNLTMNVYYADWDGVTTPAITDYASATLIHKIHTTDDEIVLDTIFLPSSGTFMIFLIPSMLDTVSGGATGLTRPDFEAIIDGGGVYFGGEVHLQTSDEPEINANKHLENITHHNAYSVWDPNATPPGGKLKVRLPDATWRIVGDEAGSDTERLKLQTPDLTWWKEYRATDGAVPVHPLKLYTADGWVTASMMTPE
jgi:hypothetical protein